MSNDRGYSSSNNESCNSHRAPSRRPPRELTSSTGSGSQPPPWPSGSARPSTPGRPSTSNTMGSRGSSSSLPGPSRRGTSSGQGNSSGRATPASGYPPSYTSSNYPPSYASRDPNPLASYPSGENPESTESFAAASSSSSSISIRPPQRRPTPVPVSNPWARRATPVWWTQTPQVPSDPGPSTRPPGPARTSGPSTGTSINRLSQPRARSPPAEPRGGGGRGGPPRGGSGGSSGLRDRFRQLFPRSPPR